MRHMHPYLMGAPRLQKAMDEACGSEFFYQLIMGDGVAAMGGFGYCHFGSVVGASADGGFYLAFWGERAAPNYRLIAPLQLAIATMGGKLCA